MENAEIPVKINIKTTIDAQETYELTVFGRFFQKENASYLQYEEVQEEGRVRTIVKLAADELLILRSGAVKMRLPFRSGELLRGSYELPFGVFEAITHTKKMTVHSENGSGQIAILYDFSLDGAPAGTYHLEISFGQEN